MSADAVEVMVSIGPSDGEQHAGRRRRPGANDGYDVMIVGNQGALRRELDQSDVTENPDIVIDGAARLARYAAIIESALVRNVTRKTGLAGSVGRATTDTQVFRQTGFTPAALLRDIEEVPTLVPQQGFLNDVAANESSNLVAP